MCTLELTESTLHLIQTHKRDALFISIRGEGSRPSEHRLFICIQSNAKLWWLFPLLHIDMRYICFPPVPLPLSQSFPLMHYIHASAKVTGSARRKVPRFNPWLLHTLTQSVWEKIIEKDIVAGVTSERGSHFLMDVLTFRINGSDVPNYLWETTDHFLKANCSHVPYGVYPAGRSFGE